MKRPYILWGVLWCLLLVQQAARADSQVVFSETFDLTEGQGGRDDSFGGTLKNGEYIFDNEGWSLTSCTGAYHCVKFGTNNANGICITPYISLKTGTSATLTFNVAGWSSGNNKLDITAEGCTLSGDVSIAKLTNGEWREASVTISDITGPVQITFTGKRGFLDDVKITGEPGGDIEVTVPAPTLTDEFTFWSNTIEATKRLVTITPAEGTIVHYTTDGSEPSITDGIEISAATTLFVWSTTTIKAIAIKSIYTSDVIAKTYTLGEPVNSIADFCALADGTEAKLFLSAEQNARITAVNGKQFTLKDDTNTLLFDFGDVTFNPTPAVNQHVAGWIIGKKQTIDDKSTFVATILTTPAYIAFAAPVTEPDITSIKTINTQHKSASESYYTLSGLQVKNPKKGIYIASGKKLTVH